MGFTFEENIVSFCVGGIKLYFILVFRVISTVSVTVYKQVRQASSFVQLIEP